MALEGSWGAGKSTIVNLVCEGLSGAERGVYVFDAWAHQGDPLRRSFLEGLIESLNTKEWTRSRNEWEAEKAKLSGRERVVERETQQHAGTFGKISAVALLLVPLGIALFSSGLSRWEPWRIGVGVVFVLAPVLAALGWLAIWQLKLSKSSQRQQSDGKGIKERAADDP
jgi:hypothetical protein